MPVRLGFLACALVLAGCASSPRPAPAPTGMTWILVEADRYQPALFYGFPDSDNLEFALECRPGSGQVEITLYGPALRPPRHLAIASGPVRGRAAVRSQPDELFDEIHLAVTPADSPALTRFASTGELAIGLDRPTLFPPAPTATSRRFIDICRGGR